MEAETLTRRAIEKLVEAGNLRGLLDKAGELHGHLCNYLTYGVMAGYIAVHELGVKSTGMEEVVAIVETNNCFSDGVQMVTGCTFGNNSLIYKDFGKTAVTLAKRDGTAIRITLDPDFEEASEKEYPKLTELWNKIIVKREQPTPQEHETMMRLFREMSLKELSKPTAEMFRIRHVIITLPQYAPIFASVRCSICGEKVVETRAKVKEGKAVCMGCAGGEYYMLDGRGISTNWANLKENLEE